MRILLVLVILFLTSPLVASDWKSEPVWHDGLVEKAVYTASRVVYGKPRAYEMVVFTNKEQHDRKTLTKAEKSTDTVEMFKHNHIEVIPTPNYDYKYETTSHLTVDGLQLTRLDCSSQEFCGTSFKQFMRVADNAWDYWSFSYMPEAGRQTGSVDARNDLPVIPEDALPLWLRDYDFAGKRAVRFYLLPSQKSNRPTPHAPRTAEIRYAGEESGSHKLELHVFQPTKMAGTEFDQGSNLQGTYWMAADRLHVMTRYRSGDGQQTYELKDLSRVNYWTIQGE